MATAPTIPIQKIDHDHGVDLRTGEVIEFQHKSNRAEDKASVAQSLKKLRDIINANLTEPDNALWVTLTYAENMQDSTQLYEDFRRFWQRFKYYLRKQNYPSANYIAVAEPQARKAWHLHALLLYSQKAPFIPNAEIARLWGHGFTKTKSLKGLGNPGLYLTAYLGDMELSEAIAAGKFTPRALRATKTGSKSVVKGARLNMYPPGFNLYRCSRGIKRPENYQMTEEEAQALVANTSLTYEKTISISDESDTVRNIINYRTYTKTAAASSESEVNN